MVSIISIGLAIYVNYKLPPGYRTLLMAATNAPTVAGFAMMAWADGKAPRLIGYCTSFTHCGVTIIVTHRPDQG